MEMKDGRLWSVSFYGILNHIDSQPAQLRGGEGNVAFTIATRKAFSLGVFENI